MECDAAREALSAALDGELGPDESGALDAHVAGCAACRAVARDLAGLHRAVRVRPAEEVPDLVPSVLAAARLPAPRRRPDLEWARYALLAVALTQLVLALPALVLGEGSGASVHVARELGSFDVALAAGLLLAAWHPHRATGLLPFAAALAAGITITGIADAVAGRTTLAAESPHLLDVAGVALLWLVAKASIPPVTRSTRARLA